MTIYMKIDGIDGNITAKGHEKWIEIFEFSFGLGRGISSNIPGHQSNREASIPSFTEVTIRKEIDEVSPKLFLESCIGKAKNVEVHFCHTGDNIQTFLEFKLTDVLFSGYDFDGGTGQPLEKLFLNFSKIEQKYTPFDDKHVAKSPIPAGYDLIQANKI